MNAANFVGTIVKVDGIECEVLAVRNIHFCEDKVGLLGRSKVDNKFLRDIIFDQKLFEKGMVAEAANCMNARIIDIDGSEKECWKQLGYSVN